MARRPRAKGSDAAERMMRRTFEAWELVSLRILISDIAGVPGLPGGIWARRRVPCASCGHMSVAGRMSHPPFTDILGDWGLDVSTRVSRRFETSTRPRGRGAPDCP